MSFLQKIFGKTQLAADSDGLALEGAVNSLAALLTILGQVRSRPLTYGPEGRKRSAASGRGLHKSGGKMNMLAARDALRVRHSWAIANLEAIWASLPERTKVQTPSARRGAWWPRYTPKDESADESQTSNWLPFDLLITRRRRK